MVASIRSNPKDADQPQYYAPCVQEVLDRMAQNARARIHFVANGQHVEKTFSACHADVSRAAQWLVLQGVQAGAVVGIHAETSYAWVLADLACAMLGAISLALYTRAPLARVREVLREVHCDILLSDSAEALSAASMRDVRSLPLQMLERAALESEAVMPACAEKSWHYIAAGTPLTIVSTSGTLSEPKLFRVCIEPLLITVREMARRYALEPGDRLLMCLPLAHLPQRMLLYGCIERGMDIILSSPTRIRADSLALLPTFVVVVPKILDHFKSRICSELERFLGPLGRKLAAAFGESRAGFVARLFPKFHREILGERMRLIIVGSAPTSASTLRFLRTLQFPICEAYGTTEIGIIAFGSPTHWRMGYIGPPVPWCKLKFDSETSEIMVSTPLPFRHSWVSPAGSVADPAPDCYLGSGDAGQLDGGFLRVLGRLRDFVALETGKKVFVAPIEASILAFTEVAGVAVTADALNRRLRAIIIVQDDGADSRRLMRSCERIRSDIAAMNVTVHPMERVHSVTFVPAALAIPKGCLTDTGKTRRHVLISLYGGEPSEVL